MNPDERVFQPNFPHGGSTIPRIQSNIVAETNINAKHDQQGGKRMSNLKKTIVLTIQRVTMTFVVIKIAVLGP